MFKALKTGFVVADYTMALVKTYSAAGGSLEALAQHHGVTVTELCRPTDDVSVDRYLAMLKQAQVILADPFFGLHVGQNMDLDSFSILGKALLNSKTLGDALQQVLSLESLVHTLGVSDVTREQGSVRLTWRCHYQQHPMAPVLVESILGGIIEFSQQLSGRSIPIMATQFVHAQPPHSKGGEGIEYGRVYRSRCDFSCATNSILFADDVLGWPNQLYGADGVAQEPAGSVFLRSVEDFLRKHLSEGNPLMADVANHYNLTIRTFQRRLAKEGVTFNQVLARTRATLAQDYLKYSNLSALEISQLLGFREQSSFNHFFIDQLSVSPMKFRQQFNARS